MNVDLSAFNQPKGWLCPSCGKAHGPHVDTCPALEVKTNPPVPTYGPFFFKPDWQAQGSGESPCKPIVVMTLGGA